MSFFEIKNFLFMMELAKSFSVLGAVSKSESNLDTLRDMGKVCSKVSFTSEWEHLKN